MRSRGQSIDKPRYPIIPSVPRPDTPPQIGGSGRYDRLVGANRNIPSGKERLIGNSHYPVGMWVVFIVYCCVRFRTLVFMLRLKRYWTQPVRP